MTVHELSQLVLEWIWARPKPLHMSLIVRCGKGVNGQDGGGREKEWDY
jgi:hypothetical protein